MFFTGAAGIVIETLPRETASIARTVYELSASYFFDNVLLESAVTSILSILETIEKAVVVVTFVESPDSFRAPLKLAKMADLVVKDLLEMLYAVLYAAN